MYVNHTERSNANQNQNLSEVNPIMPGKWKQPPQVQPYSSVFHRNIPELNNMQLEVNNFVDLLYVSFDNRPVPPNELYLNNGGRLELMLDADDEEKATSKSRNERYAKRSSLRDGCSSSFSLRSDDDKFSDKNDLKNGAKGSANKPFSPALLNGKAYKPNRGLQEPLLYSGSRFVGFQKSNAGGTKPNCYGVEVTIQHCDLENFFICGHLKINGLTDEYPTLTTFFEGEIISKQKPFLTRKYDTDCDVDRVHWSRFAAFMPYLNSLSEENYDYSKINSNYIFMRWKEEFLVSDHKIKKIDGACFDGFYYCCLNRLTGSIEGLYFHKQAEAFQLLSLKHEDSKSKSRWNKIYEFR